MILQQITQETLTDLAQHLMKLLIVKIFFINITILLKINTFN